MSHNHDVDPSGIGYPRTTSEPAAPSMHALTTQFGSMQMVQDEDSYIGDPRSSLEESAQSDCIRLFSHMAVELVNKVSASANSSTGEKSSQSIPVVIHVLQGLSDDLEKNCPGSFTGKLSLRESAQLDWIPWLSQMLVELVSKVSPAIRQKIQEDSTGIMEQAVVLQGLRVMIKFLRGIHDSLHNDLAGSTTGSTGIPAQSTQTAPTRTVVSPSASANRNQAMYSDYRQTPAPPTPTASTTTTSSPSTILSQSTTPSMASHPPPPPPPTDSLDPSFNSNLGGGLGDFDPCLFDRPNSSLNFERDFAAWFDPEND